MLKGIFSISLLSDRVPTTPKYVLTDSWFSSEGFIKTIRDIISIFPH